MHCDKAQLEAMEKISEVEAEWSEKYKTSEGPATGSSDLFYRLFSGRLLVLLVAPGATQNTAPLGIT